MDGVVYIVQDDGSKNFSPALKFGSEIIALRKYDLPMTKLGQDDAIRAIHHGLRNFTPDKDFLLLSGDPLLISMAVYTLLTNHGHVNCLKWDRQSTDYLIKKLDVRTGGH